MYLDNKKIKMITGVCLFLLMAMTVALPVLAGDNEGDAIYGLEDMGELGLGKQDLKATIGSVISVILGFLGVVAIVIVLMGGFKYMTAGGAAEKTDEAKKYIINGIIGLAIILAAYAITSFVLDSLMTATTE